MLTFLVMVSLKSRNKNVAFLIILFYSFIHPSLSLSLLMMSFFTSFIFLLIYSFLYKGHVDQARGVFQERWQRSIIRRSENLLLKYYPKFDNALRSDDMFISDKFEMDSSFSFYGNGQRMSG